RQVADSYAGRVIDGIGDCRIGADIAELAQTLDAQIVDQVIFLGDQDHLGHVDVGIDRDQIFGEIGVVVTGAPAIYFGRLVQGRGDAPDQTAHELALGGRRVDNAAGGERADDARTADLACSCVHPDFDEFGAKGELN